MPSQLKPIAQRMTRIADAPMAMRPEAIKALAASVVMVREFDEPPKLEACIFEESPSADEAKVPRIAKIKGSVAVVPVFGGIGQHRGSDYWGGVFSEELTGMVRQLVDSPNIGAVVLSIDSPGGIVYGIPEAARAIREMKQVKPIFSAVKAQAASAAYWLASSTTKIFAQPSADVGSIGVWTMHVDQSKMLEEWGLDISLISAGKHKVEGHPFGALDDNARAELQRSVDGYYDDFLADVALGRNVSKATVKNDFGEGRMIEAPRAKSLGMIDGIATLNELLAGIMAPAGNSKRRSMATKIALEDAWDGGLD